MDRIHNSWFTKGKATGRIYMVRGETYKETKNFSSWWCVARYVENYVQCSKKRGQIKKWAIEKPNLYNARRLRGIFLFEPKEIQAHTESRSEKVGSSDASSNASKAVKQTQR